MALTLKIKNNLGNVSEDFSPTTSYETSAMQCNGGYQNFIFLFKHFRTEQICSIALIYILQFKS